MLRCFVKTVIRDSVGFVLTPHKVTVFTIGRNTVKTVSIVETRRNENEIENT